MGKFKNRYSIWLLIWIAAIVLSITTLPDLNKLVKEKGQITLPEEFESEKASLILNDLKNEGKETNEFAIVFHDEKGITKEEKNEINKILSVFSSKPDKFYITDTLFYNENEQNYKQLVSKDNTTIINKVTVKKDEELDSKDIADIFEKELKNTKVDSYITGASLIKEDFANTTQDGVKKTEVIAIIFIIVVLIIVFKSPIVPFVSLLSVGVSYLVSLAIVAQLVEHFSFPFSNFTQVFLVVILFGIGTDYNILLFNRFKEELNNYSNVKDAIKETYRTAGKTVIYSAIAVIFGLSSLFFATFSFYQATGGTAIGVVVLLIVLLTLNPFFMMVLGKTLFYPSKKIEGHAESKLWHFLSKTSFKFPFVGLFLVALISIPSILNYSGSLNYNDLVEIDDQIESKKAINLISDKFPAGMSDPATLVIKTDKDLSQTEYLQEIDRLTDRLNEIDSVEKVLSVTQPEGKKINQLYLDSQTVTLSNSLNELSGGVQDIQTGIKNASEQQNEALKQYPPQMLKPLSPLLKEQEKGSQQISEGLSKIDNGLHQTVSYTSDLSKNLPNVIYVPKNILESESFSKSIETYLSDDRKTATITIILKENPYSIEALNDMKEIRKIAHAYIKGSSLHDSKTYMAGKASENVDLEKLSKEDFSSSLLMILIGISIMLLFITRSFSQTLIILVSLIVSGFASLGITELINTHLLHSEHLSWNVPFFTFIMLITLGVDYSIFLMMRYNEFKDENLSIIVEACKKMGSTIISAAIILGGTFAALIPSGITTLIQISIAVMIGLVILALILMPVFIPSLFGLANLFRKNK